MQELAENPDLLQLILARDQLFTTRTRTVDVDCREDTLFGDAAIEVDFGVTRTLELFVDHIVHARTGIDQRRCENGQRPAFLDIASGTEEALRTLQGIRIDTASQHLAGARNDRVVRA